MSSFAVRYDPWCRWLLRVTGMGPRHSRVVVGDATVRVQLGIGFRATIERGSIRALARHDGRVLGWGVHGWRGRWLVNGSSRGIVVLTIEPRARGWVLGVPVRVRELAISLEDPTGCASALGLELSS